jgi:hypothetical protein
MEDETRELLLNTDFTKITQEEFYNLTCDNLPELRTIFCWAGNELIKWMMLDPEMPKHIFFRQSKEDKDKFQRIFRILIETDINTRIKS